MGKFLIIQATRANLCRLIQVNCLASIMYFYVLFTVHFVKACIIGYPHKFSVHTLTKIVLVKFRSRSSIGVLIHVFAINTINYNEFYIKCVIMPKTTCRIITIQYVLVKHICPWQQQSQYLNVLHFNFAPSLYQGHVV